MRQCILVTLLYKFFFQSKEDMIYRIKRITKYISKILNDIFNALNKIHFTKNYLTLNSCNTMQL